MRRVPTEPPPNHLVRRPRDLTGVNVQGRARLLLAMRVAANACLQILSVAMEHFVNLHYDKMCVHVESM